MIIRSYSSRLLTVNKPADAINLYDVANNHPRMSTRVLLEETHDLVVADGDFECNVVATAHNALVRAFSKTSGTPYLLKFGTDVRAEYQSFSALDLSEAQALAQFIVPMVLVECPGGHRSALRLPVMTCSLDVVPCLTDELVLERLAANIVPALCYMHGRHVYHMDVKPENILIGPGDHWFLCDLGSAVMGEGQVVRQGLTPAYIPRDLRRVAEKQFDYTLLVICAILKVLPRGDCTPRFSELTLQDVDNIVRNRLTVALRTFCLNLLSANE